MKRCLNIPKVSLSSASVELGMDDKTLQKVMDRAGLKQPAKSLYRWKDIVRAMAGDDKAERTRKVRAEADLLELERKELQRELVRLSDVCELQQRLNMPVRERIDELASKYCDRVNPADSKHAYNVLKEATDEIIKSIDSQLSAIQQKIEVENEEEPEN